MQKIQPLYRCKATNCTSKHNSWFCWNQYVPA